jgi:hypothetical protein
MTDEIKGLNADLNIRYIYIKHDDNETVWKLTRSSAEHSGLLKESIIDNPNSDSYGTKENNPFAINNVSIETIPFIIEYMNHFDGKSETEPPEKPVKNIHLSVIFGDEYPLFTKIYNSEESVKTKILKLNDHIESALYFCINNLHKKLCAIIASIFKDLTIKEIKQLIE